MAIELKVPEIGESITEVEVGEWHKKQGERVAKDEPVVDVESEKASVELPAPVAGIVGPILKQTGEMAQVGDVLCTIEPVAVEKEDQPASDATVSVPSVATDASPIADASAVAVPSASIKVMPAARRIIEKESLDPEKITPSGPGGRILKEDAVAAAGQPQAIPSSTAVDVPVFQRTNGETNKRVERVTRMSMLRRTIASRLVEAKQNAALLTTFNEIDMLAVKNMRSSLQGEFVEAHGIKLGFMSFFVKATVAALKKFPLLNAEIRGKDIVQRDYFDIGIAVGSGKGLVVPVIRNAETMSFAAIEQAIADLGKRATEGKLEASELEGGTFTISNGGVYGSMLSTPIVNPPQSGILGLHAIKDRAVVVAGEIVIRPVMYVALTYDHRIVDGKEAVTCLKTIKESIESPARLLLEI